MTPITYTITATDHERRLDQFLKRQDLPYHLIQKWSRKGLLRINGKRVRNQAVLQTNDEVSHPTLETALKESFKRTVNPIILKRWEDLLTSITLYKDDFLWVINKPAGLATQGGTKVTEHLDGMLSAVYPDARPLITHRLDKDTTGVLVLARHRVAAQYLTQAFADKLIKKTYVALVAGIPEKMESTIKAPLLKAGDTEKMTIDPKGKPAETEYEVIDASACQKAACLKLVPLTGRTHQLRAHTAWLGTPIIADGKYGGRAAHISPNSDALHLHAHTLTIPLPNQEKPLFVKAPLPTPFTTTAKHFDLNIKKL
jgi:23S rRNA pseudouridine955/2504/2580 synthase